MSEREAGAPRRPRHAWVVIAIVASLVGSGACAPDGPRLRAPTREATPPPGAVRTPRPETSGSLGPTPTPVRRPTETPAEANRRVLGGVPADRRVDLAPGVIAIRAGLPEGPRQVLLYDFATNSQVFLDASGDEVARFIEGDGATRLDAVLADPELKAKVKRLLP